MLVTSLLDFKKPDFLPALPPPFPEQIITRLQEALPAAQHSLSALPVNRHSLRVKEMVEEALERGLIASLAVITCDQLLLEKEELNHSELLYQFHVIARNINGHLGPSNISVVHDSGHITLAVFTGVRIDINLYFQQLKTALQKLFSPAVCEKIQYESRGSSTFSLEVLEFLYGEW